jgi:hypothetical protein
LGIFPNSFSTAVIDFFIKIPEHDFSLGSCIFSTNKTLQPASAAFFAAIEPAGPDPTTITSYILFFLLK